MLASPMLITQSGVYLGYLWSLGLGLLFGASLLAGLRLRTWWRLIAAGVLLGALFITRPFDAVLWAVVMGGYTIFTTWRQWARQVRAAGVRAGGDAAVPGADPRAELRRHREVHPVPVHRQGAARQLRVRVPAPAAHIMGIDYTLREAVKGTGLSGLYLPQFLMGSYVTILVAGFGLWFRRRDRTTLLLLGMMVAFPVGYFGFWGNRLASGFAYLSGPVYFMPLFVPLCIFLATALVADSGAATAGGWSRSCCVLVVATVPFLYDKARMNHNISAAQEPWKEASAKLPANSLVIVRDSGPYLLHLNPYSENTPDLDGPVLYAVDHNAKNFDVIAAHPHRTPYMEITSNTALDDAIHHSDASPPQITVAPIRVHSGAAVTFTVKMTNPQGAPSVVASIQVGDRSEQRVLTPDPSGTAPTPRSSRSCRSRRRRTRPRRAPGVGHAGRSPSSPASGTTRRRRLVAAAAREFTYRVRDGAVQVLTPARKTVIQLVDGLIVQQDVGSLSNLRVGVDAS